jgi:hypothetical protein
MFARRNLKMRALEPPPDIFLPGDISEPWRRGQAVFVLDVGIFRAMKLGLLLLPRELQLEERRSQPACKLPFCRQ